ncbi:transcription intermediary factor 1-beta-like [Mytilus californianus]|uniref:transcription intermediary factor 1-beta-like n=1 Tax=Mytilus californianus TaxID=6549 RepID=UPI002246656C|nr:transcription intermediary factor 1-beta-like [Mytilus californianus]
MAQTADSTCEICTGEPGDHYCQQCDQLFCGNCKLSHLRTKISKNHTFLSGININKEEKLLCTEHEEMFFFFCQDCDTPVCKTCNVEKHSRHLMTDLTKSTEKLKSELAEDIKSKVTTSRQNVSKIEKETKIYSEEVKAVIKTITDEGKHWKKLIDQKVESFIKLVQDKEQKALQNMSVLTKVFRGEFEIFQHWQKTITEMETIADVLMLRKLKQLKLDVDNIDSKPVPERSSVSYEKKKPAGTEIDSLFGELKFKSPSVQWYIYMCTNCCTEQVSTIEPERSSSLDGIEPERSSSFDGGEGLFMECIDDECSCEKQLRWHELSGKA